MDITTEVINLDETMDHSDVCYIDETPLPIVMKEVTNEQPNTRSEKEKKSMKKRKSFERNKKRTEKFRLKKKAARRDNWILNKGANDAITTTISKSLSENNSMLQSCSELSSNAEKSSYQSEIVILSEDDSNNEGIEIIELSDEEDSFDTTIVKTSTGVIGGELLASMKKVSQFCHLSPMNQNYLNNPNSNNSLKHHWSKKSNSAIKNMNKKSSPSSAKIVQRVLRPIVIDGSNVAFGHGNKTTFSSKGLKICCDYFIERGHQVKIFIPLFRRRHKATSDYHILDELEKNNILVFTPSRNVNGKNIVSYDDRYIVEYAYKCGGVIVSRDNYQDLIKENHKWKETVDHRLLMFTFVDDMIMFPYDPLGRNGILLDDFLSFPPGQSKETQLQNTEEE